MTLLGQESPEKKSDSPEVCGEQPLKLLFKY